MDPVALLVVVGGGSMAAAFGLTRWLSRRRERVWATAAGVLDAPLAREPLSLHLQADDDDLRATLHVGQRSVQLEIVARSVLPDGPRFYVRRWNTDVRVEAALAGLEDVPIGDALFDRMFLVSTDEPRSMGGFLDPARRRLLMGLRPGFGLERSEGRVRLTWRAEPRSAEELLDAIAFVRALAAVGDPVLHLLRGLPGVRERGRGASGPFVFELDEASVPLRLRPVWWRTGIALSIEADGTRRLPRFAVRWDADGAVHGDPPEGLVALVEVSPRDALLRYDGESFHLLARARDADGVRALTRLVARLARAPSPGGVFR